MKAASANDERWCYTRRVACKRVTAGTVQWTLPTPRRLSVVEKAAPGIRARIYVVKVSGCSGVPIYLEHGPVALLWCYRGKRGDLWVAFFLRV